MLLSPRLCLITGALGVAVSAAAPTPAAARQASIREEIRTLTTYPFSRPNPIPILGRDARLYPYHAFDGYAAEGVPRDWKVVVLENAHVEVYVLPEAGGKVWGAMVKRTGHEFIYRNEVMKFRNIALRGPWTSGGIEFNFGVIGHTPSTATPVEYVVRENPDGSVSCIVGTMDLPSRTHWRVEVRLPADRAVFETRVLWYNPTPLEHPYYNWMTAAAFARPDLVMSIPGHAFLEHSGAVRMWPENAAGRYLPAYAENTFGGHKSYHVVGEVNDFFGGYYVDDDYGFGHWAPYDEMPGQKLWLWALSREGGVWEDLLTDTDGQYVEYQAGRMLVQYQPAGHVNPITHAGFDPGAADRWSETWFPLEGIGGLTDASPDAAMFAQHEDGRLTVRLHAFRAARDTLRIWAGGREVAAEPLTLGVLEPFTYRVPLSDATAFRVAVPGLGLDYRSDPASRTLSRPFRTPPDAFATMPPADRWAFAGRQLTLARRHAAARAAFDSALAGEPWHREALLGQADLEYRRGRYGAGLALADRARQLDAYDARANFVAGNLLRALGRTADARDAFGWASRSMAYRAAASVQLAEIALAARDLPGAERYARRALDYDRHNLPARQILALAARRAGDLAAWQETLEQLLARDPLHHFVHAERLVQSGAQTFPGALQNEYPEQVLLELAIDYVRRGASEEALRMLELPPAAAHPLARAWRAWVLDDPSTLPDEVDVAFVFPYRRETIPVLEWAVARTGHWSWRYLLALNYWGRDRPGAAGRLFTALGGEPDYAPVYAARAAALAPEGRDPEPDLRRAATLDPDTPALRIGLIRHLQASGQWAEALAESAAARRRFPGDFNFDLLHVRSLNQLRRAEEAIPILDAVRVLPSENSRESHRLYETAHLLVALARLESGDAGAARRHLRAALEWPEHLGQGRPYDPDHRVARFLLAVTEQRVGNRTAAVAAYEAVIDAAERRPGEINRRALLTVPALVALGRLDALPPIVNDPAPGVPRLVQAMVGAARSGRDPAAAALGMVGAHPEMWDDLDGEILRRALQLVR